MFNSLLKIFATASAGVVAGVGATATIPVVPADTTTFITGIVSSLMAWYVGRVKD